MDEFGEFDKRFAVRGLETEHPMVQTWQERLEMMEIEIVKGTIFKESFLQGMKSERKRKLRICGEE